MKPHIYRFNGAWWVSRNGLASFRSGITLNDIACPSLRLAMNFAASRCAGLR